MSRIEKEHLSSTIILNYSDRLKGIKIFKNKQGIISVELDLEELSLFNGYPNIIKSLIDGQTLYIRKGWAYLGTSRREGTYGEETVFKINYKSNSNKLRDMLYNIETDIIKDNEHIKKGI